MVKRFTRLAAGLLGCALLSHLPADLAAQAEPERASLRGRVVDADGLEPVEDALVSLGETRHRGLTDAEGRFLFDGVAPGTYLVVVERLGFGRGADSLVVGEAGDLDLQIRLTREAIELEALTVEVLSREELERRSRGTRRNRVTRAQIEEMAGRALHVGDVLELHVPGVSVDVSSGAAGSRFCLEFRRPPSLVAPRACHPPLVVVDGVRVFDATGYLNSVTLVEIESIEVLGPAEAGTVYGSHGGWGVVLIETRRPWVDGEEERVRPATAYDWSVEPGGHPWKRALAGAALGTAGTLGLVLHAAGDCSPLNEARDAECPGSGANAYGVAAFTLPVLGAAAGANLLGRTEASRGEFLRTALLTATPMLTGYFFATPQGGRGAFEKQALFGKLLVAVGVPVVATLADRLFRDSVRGEARGPER